LKTPALSSEEKTKLNGELKAALKSQNDANKDYKKAQAAVQNVAKNVKHSNDEKCPECKLMADAVDAGKRQDLKRSWQIAFGQTKAKPNWGPQAPCSGRGGGYGCEQLRKDNGVENLSKTAEQLAEGKNPPEASLCKRGDSSCEKNHPKNPKP
jgi:hypothetical protein